MRLSKKATLLLSLGAGMIATVWKTGRLSDTGSQRIAQRSTLAKQFRHDVARDQELRNFVLNEPRGGVFRHVNLLVPPKNPRAQMGFIIMEPEDTPPMSGSNCICVATVLLDAGIIPMKEPVTHLTLEAPAGLIEVAATCRNGKAESITLTNVPAFAAHLGVTARAVRHWAQAGAMEILCLDEREHSDALTAVLLTPYPPGIPLLIPGERFNRTIVRYLQFAREFNERFPGFETDVHGLVKEMRDGRIHYFVDCVRG